MNYCDHELTHVLGLALEPPRCRLDCSNKKHQMTHKGTQSDTLPQVMLLRVPGY